MCSWTAMDRTIELYERFEQLLEQQGINYVPGFDIRQSNVDSDSALGALLAIQKYTTEAILRAKPNKGFPAGNWYMITITQKDTETKEDILIRHEKTMDYFRYHHIEVYLAALEKGSMYHVHYSVNIPRPAKNEGRDLTKITGRRVVVESKAKDLQRWQGLFKYLLKRDYCKEKKDTQVELLLSRVRYEEGKGYILTD